jgi:hypothetical protein
MSSIARLPKRKCFTSQDTGLEVQRERSAEAAACLDRPAQVILDHAEIAQGAGLADWVCDAGKQEMACTAFRQSDWASL